MFHRHVVVIDDPGGCLRGEPLEDTYMVTNCRGTEGFGQSRGDYEESLPELGADIVERAYEEDPLNIVSLPFSLSFAPPHLEEAGLGYAADVFEPLSREEQRFLSGEIGCHIQERVSDLGRYLEERPEKTADIIIELRQGGLSTPGLN